MRDDDQLHVSARLQAEARRNLSRFIVLFIVIESLSDRNFDPGLNSRLLNHVYRTPGSDITSLDHMLSAVITNVPEDQRQLVMAATIIRLLYFALDDDE